MFTLLAARWLKFYKTQAVCNLNKNIKEPISSNWKFEKRRSRQPTGWLLAANLI